ncbi:MAG: gamma-glutamylcyclotransferase [Chloroflexi bacterium]|nr:MAG: gamma-glutamylcyclotransferase [Chloroflexota bacterium]
MTDKRMTYAGPGGQLDAFFVYGTLRPGQPNFRVIAPLVVETAPAILHNHVLYGRRLPFPYATPGTGRVVGYAGEGRPNHYVRRAVRVVTERGTLPAWVYLAGISASRLSPSQVIHTGDWREVAGAADASDCTHRRPGA